MAIDKTTALTRVSAEFHHDGTIARRIASYRTTISEDGVVLSDLHKDSEADEATFASAVGSAMAGVAAQLDAALAANKILQAQVDDLTSQLSEKTKAAQAQMDALAGELAAANANAATADAKATSLSAELVALKAKHADMATALAGVTQAMQA